MTVPSGAQFEIKVVGVVHRDQRDIAIEAGRFLQQRNPGARITVTDLRDGSHPDRSAVMFRLLWAKRSTPASIDKEVFVHEPAISALQWAAARFAGDLAELIGRTDFDPDDLVAGATIWASAGCGIRTGHHLALQPPLRLTAPPAGRSVSTAEPRSR